MTALEEIKKAEHKRIWLEPAGAPDRCWCQDNQWGEEGVEYVLATTLESLQRENERLRQFLFPYADRTDISGISWDGKYLIGDKASITAFHEMKTRGEQIDVYKRAYDQNEAALKARAEAAEAEVKRLRSWQPIETAPKESSEPYICYSPGNPRAQNQYARDPHYHIDGFSECWPRGRNQYPESPYTHWMPLPASPAKQDG